MSASPCTSQLGSTNELWNVNQEVQEQVSKSCNEIEVLKVMKGVHKQVHEPISVPKSAKLPKKLPCKGVCITFPEGMSQPTSYPFGIHSMTYLGTTNLLMTISTFKPNHVRNGCHWREGYARIARDPPQVPSTQGSCIGSSLVRTSILLWCTGRLRRYHS